jgi:hypothetical protein
LEVAVTNDENSDPRFTFTYPVRENQEGAAPATFQIAELSNGRFRADVVYDATFNHDGIYWSTSAGVLKTDTEGKYDRLWPLEQGALGARRYIGRRPSDSALYAWSNNDDLVKLDDELTGEWKMSEVDESFRYEMEVLHQSELWTWSRWRGEMLVQLHRTDESAETWPLFHNGRFSFDSLKSFQLDDQRLWAATAGGIVVFRTDNMAIEFIHRLAMDERTQQTHLLSEAEEFVGTEPLACQGGGSRFEFRGEDWKRISAFDAPARMVVEGSNRWKSEPLSLDGGRAGLFVGLHDASGALRKQWNILLSTPAEKFRGVAAAGGCFWIASEDGLYVLKPH